MVGYKKIQGVQLFEATQEMDSGLTTRSVVLVFDGYAVGKVSTLASVIKRG